LNALTWSTIAHCLLRTALRLAELLAQLAVAIAGSWAWALFCCMNKHFCSALALSQHQAHAPAATNAHTQYQGPQPCWRHAAHDAQEHTAAQSIQLRHAHMSTA
jgi:hypothetical protein